MVTAEPLPTLETAQGLGLSPDEFDKIKKILGRTPNFTELSVYSVMWSEHCSYKNSILQLKTLPRSGKRLLVGAGEENAGLVDIGDGLGCAFKIESHNHPSAIEPYQGAATGVGRYSPRYIHDGRPADRFPEQPAFRQTRQSAHETPHCRRGQRHWRLWQLLRRAYGGGGSIFLCLAINHDILVNAMSVGIVKAGQTVSATAGEPGQPGFYRWFGNGKRRYSRRYFCLRRPERRQP
jgi:hypothetical protein